MADITIPDAAMEAAAHAMFEVTGEPDWTAMEIRQVVEAAAPYIAAQALKDMGEWFDRAAQLGTGERDVIAAQACYDRAGMIEADNG